MIIDFIGTRRGMTPAQLKAVRNIVDEFDAVEAAHHGDCVGADAEFHDICLQRGIPVVLHPPTDDKHRAFSHGFSEFRPARDYPDRNHDIVDAAEVLIAAPSSAKDKLRSDAWATVSYAQSRRKQVVIVEPGIGEDDADVRVVRLMPNSLNENQYPLRSLFMLMTIGALTALILRAVLPPDRAFHIIGGVLLLMFKVSLVSIGGTLALVYLVKVTLRICRKTDGAPCSRSHTHD